MKYVLLILLILYTYPLNAHKHYDIQEEINVLTKQRDLLPVNAPMKMLIQEKIDRLADERAEILIYGDVDKKVKEEVDQVLEDLDKGLELDELDELATLRAEVERLKKVEEEHVVAHTPDYEIGDIYTPTYEMTLDRVKERQKLICGVREDTVGFSERKYGGSEQEREGFDIDVCRAFAIALFGNPESVQYEIVNNQSRFLKLKDGTIDVLSATTTNTYTRDVIHNIDFLPTVFYDGQGFIIRNTLGIRSAKDMGNINVCLEVGSTAEQNIMDFFELWEVTYMPIDVYPDEDISELYLNGDCDTFATDRSALAGIRLNFDEPSRHQILPDVISKEPLAPAVKYGDEKFTDILRWVVYVLFVADEWNINSKNIDNFFESKDPAIQRFLGLRNGEEHDSLGEKLGIDAKFAYNIIKTIGNYTEIYYKNLTKLNLDQGYNRPFSKGGLLYAPPLR